MCSVFSRACNRYTTFCWLCSYITFLFLRVPIVVDTIPDRYPTFIRVLCALNNLILKAVFLAFRLYKGRTPFKLTLRHLFHLLKECQIARSSSPLCTGLGLNLPPNRTLQVISKGSLLNLCYFLLGADLNMPYGTLKNVFCVICVLKFLVLRFFR